jgi:hypothetical protein
MIFSENRLPLFRILLQMPGGPINPPDTPAG